MLQNSDGTRMQEAESSALVARGHEPEGEKRSDLGVIIVEDHGTLRKPAGNSMENHPTKKKPTGEGRAFQTSNVENVEQKCNSESSPFTKE